MKRHSPEKLREFLHTYLEERNRLDKGSPEVDEKDLDKLCKMVEMHEIVSGVFRYTLPKK